MALAPLSPQEVEQLEGYNRMHERGLARMSLTAFVLGAIGGLVLVAVLFPSDVQDDWSLGEKFGPLASIEDAIGTTALTYLLGALIFGGVFAIGIWRLYALLMMMRRRLQHRLDEAGRIDEPQTTTA